MANQPCSVVGSKWQIGDIVYQFNWFVNGHPEFSEYAVVEVRVRGEFDREEKKYKFSKVCYELANTLTNTPTGDSESEEYLLSRGYASSKKEAIEAHFALVQREYDKRRKNIDDRRQELDDDTLPKLKDLTEAIKAWKE